MKRMKKWFAVLLALAMALGLSMTAFAKPDAGDDKKFGTADDRGTITVSGITAEDGITVTAYQIVKATYDNNGESFSGYEELYGPGSVTMKEATDTELASISVTDEQLTAILEKITTAQVEGTAMESSDGTSYSANVPVGMYLVVISGAETKIYSNVVVSLFYTNENGENGIDEGSVAVDETQANAWVKVQEKPEVEKTITNGDKENTKHGNTVNIGDTVNYQIEVKGIPYYGGDYPTFNVIDTLDDTLEYAKDTGCALVIKDGSEEGVALEITGKVTNPDTQVETGKIVRKSDSKEMGSYTYNPANNTLTFDFVLNQNGKKVYTLNDYKGKNITISYSAVVKDNAKLSNAANENDVTLNFTRDSKVVGNDDHDDDETFTYTFDIDGQIEGSITQKIIAKVGENTIKGKREPLPGAVFTLYEASVADGVWTKGAVYTNGKEEEFNGTITSTDAEDNNLAIKGLKAGTYILQETKAPDGYSLNTHEFQIEIKAELDDVTGKLESWSITIDGEETATFGLSTDGEIVRTDENDTLAIPNTTLTELPSTGGIGTTIFTVAGCLIMIVAAGLFFASRRKTAK